MILSNHFTLEEFTRSNTASRLGINNTPSPEYIERLKKLCVDILEPARVALGPLHINSGYRSRELNEMTPGSSPTSAHTLAYAADIDPTLVTKYEFAKWVKANVKFDQIILEYGATSMYGEPAWVHVSNDPRYRGQVLRIFVGSGGYKRISI